MGQPYFLQLFDERQQKEIEFASLYAANFSHGTDGHHRLLLIAKMAEFLETLVEDQETVDFLIGTKEDE